MKGILRHVREEQEGSIVLEACFSVIIFILFVVMMYGLITVFMVQNLIGHALMESTQSLALDTYATNKLTDQFSIGEGLRRLLETVGGTYPDDPAFSSRERWFDRKSGATQDDWEKAAKQRFIGYFSGGDEKKAQNMLEAMGVVGGLNGLDFSESNVIGSDLYIRVTYQIEYLFNPFDMAKIDTAQQACSRMWGTSLIERIGTLPQTAPGKGTPDLVDKNTAVQKPSDSDGGGGGFRGGGADGGGGFRGSGADGGGGTW